MQPKLLSWIFTCSFVGLLSSSTAQLGLVEVNTAQGRVRGTTEHVVAYLLTSTPVILKSFYKFVGIPYAQPPVGSLRFKPPQPPLPWNGTRNAFLPGAECVQHLFFLPVGDEDCLYINVYTPQLPRSGVPLKAVMVWIYGGGFQAGNGVQIYGPDYLVTKDVVVVSFNYRLGVMGFLSLENNKASGNYGLKDQAQALRWVKQNIANFGGDPNRVTIFGESAGSASVHYQVLSPQSAGLFNQAIMQSGSALNSWGFAKTPKANAFKLAQHMGKNITDVDELYDFFMSESSQNLAKASWDVLVEKLEDLNTILFIDFVPCIESETVDQPFITQSPTDMMLSGTFNKVPMIIGTLNGEGLVLFIARRYTSKEFEILNNSSDWAVPINWEIKDKAERTRIGQQVKNFYFNTTKVSWNTLNEFQQYYTDVFFTVDIEKVTTAFLNHSQAPVYNFEMVYEPLRSPVKPVVDLRQLAILDFKAAAHADDLVLLFRPYLLEVIPFPRNDQIVSFKMTSMWANFAKTGNPNYSGAGVNWTKTEKNNRNYLQIAITFSVKSGRMYQKRMEFWENLCTTTNTTYKCIY